MPIASAILAGARLPKLRLVARQCVRMAGTLL